MKKTLLLLVSASGLLAGCVVDDGSYRSSGYYDDGRGTYRSGYYNDGRAYSRDRDGDGVPNRDDRRPDDPRRY